MVLVFWGNQQLSNWIEDLLNRKEFMPDTIRLADYCWPARYRTLEENLLQSLSWPVSVLTAFYILTHTPRVSAAFTPSSKKLLLAAAGDHERSSHVVQKWKNNWLCGAQPPVNIAKLCCSGNVMKRGPKRLWGPEDQDLCCKTVSVVYNGICTHESSKEMVK